MIETIIGEPQNIVIVNESEIFAYDIVWVFNALLVIIVFYFTLLFLSNLQRSLSNRRSKNE